jgi:hypothetical protein
MYAKMLISAIGRARAYTFHYCQGSGYKIKRLLTLSICLIINSFIIKGRMTNEI